MSVEQKLTDKNVMTTTANLNSTKNKKNHNSKKLIKKALKTSKTKKTNSNINNSFNNSNNNKNKNKNNNTEAANDEIIEEFDFSDTDLRELDANNECKSNNNSNFSNRKLKNKIVENSKEGELVVQLEKLNIIDNNDDEDINKQQQQVKKIILPSSDNKDKQSEDSGELTTTKTSITTTNNFGCENEHNNEFNNENYQQQSQKEENKEHNVFPNRDTSNDDASTSVVEIANVSIVNAHLTCQAERNDKMSTSDTQCNRTNDTLETLTANNYDNNVHDDDSMADDEYAEPYDELLVQFLDEANHIAEARLAARRQARAEAREIRMRELERQQKEQESNADRVFDMHTTATGITPLSHIRLGIGNSPVTSLLNSTRGNSMSSRRSSEDSLEEEGRSLRDIRHELKDVEERFRKAMIANAQLDNDRASQTYQIQLLKDKLEDMEESYSQLQRECKEKTRDCNALKRSLDKLSEELKLVQGQLNERDTLIAEQGLVIVAIENEDGTDAKRALVRVENAQLLGSVQGSLDVRLKKFSEEKQQLYAEVQQLQEQLEKYKSQGKGRGKVNSSNGPLGSDDDEYEAQREANKIISDYKYKLQKAEQEIASLQSSLARSETQVIRYKSTAEAAEKAEAELKIERRKLQRENREAMEKLEELETSNNHLLKRLDKLKNAKSALLKDL